MSYSHYLLGVLVNIFSDHFQQMVPEVWFDQSSGSQLFFVVPPLEDRNLFTPPPPPEILLRTL